jgi:hypothetical protein
MRAKALGTCGLVLSLALASGCDLNDLIPEDARTLTIPADSEVTVPGSIDVGNNPLVDNEIFPSDFGGLLSNQLEQSFSTENVQKEAVASMKLTKLTVTVTNPEEGGRQVRDLSFIDSLDFYLSAGELDPRLVAESADGAFADDPISYDFELTDAELADLLDAGDAMTMTADLVPGDRPNFATDLLFEAELTVIVDAAGAVASGS